MSEVVEDYMEAEEPAATVEPVTAATTVEPVTAATTAVAPVS